VTPVYKSPDHDEANAILEILSEHNIVASIIKTRPANNSASNSRICWYELWLRNQTDVRHAETIITQFEFISYKNSLANANIMENNHQIVADTPKDIFPQSLTRAPAFSTPTTLTSTVHAAPVHSQAVHSQTTHATTTTPSNKQTGLTPINNKRVFRRLGLLLGFSEKEIEELDNNRLYRPWDSDRLMEQVNNLKRKCS